MRTARENTMRREIKRFLRDQSGGTAIEYSLVAGLMSLAIIVALKTMGSRVDTNLRNVSNGLT
jgi:pilus assembly protein Flp/PilA